MKCFSSVGQGGHFVFGDVAGGRGHGGKAGPQGLAKGRLQSGKGQHAVGHHTGGQVDGEPGSQAHRHQGQRGQPQHDNDGVVEESADELPTPWQVRFAAHLVVVVLRIVLVGKVRALFFIDDTEKTPLFTNVKISSKCRWQKKYVYLCHGHDCQGSAYNVEVGVV